MNVPGLLRVKTNRHPMAVPSNAITTNVAVMDGFAKKASLCEINPNT